MPPKPIDGKVFMLIFKWWQESSPEDPAETDKILQKCVSSAQGVLEQHRLSSGLDLATGEPKPAAS